MHEMTPQKVTKHIVNSHPCVRDMCIPYNILITGYLYSMCIEEAIRITHIPSNILAMVKRYLIMYQQSSMYCGLESNLNTCLLTIPNAHSSKPMTVYNTAQMQQSEVQLRHTRPNHSISSFNKRKTSICTIHKTWLPMAKPLKEQLHLMMDLDDKYMKYSMVALIGGIDSSNTASASCHLCAFPENSATLPYTECFEFVLPSLPKAQYGLSSVYDKYNHRIYTMNPCTQYSTSIHCMDLNTNNMAWKEITNELWMSRSNTSVCMVDKGRFIAIIGGIGTGHKYKGRQTKGTELYAINANKSIKLSLMNRYSENGASVYNEDLHNIVMGDAIGFQLYDINKDRWCHLYDRYYNTLDIERHKPNIWISDSNPFIVYFSGFKTIEPEMYESSWIGSPHNGGQSSFMVERFDLREYAQKRVVRLRDISWNNLAHYNEILSFNPNTVNINCANVAHLSF
eukprot:106762_1